MKKILIGAAVACSALAVTPAAHADVVSYELVAECPGSVVQQHVLENRLGDTQGVLKIWYSAANGGTNCVKVYDVASGRHQMSVTLRLAGASNERTDSGNFETYAGGVLAKRTAGRCLYARGTLIMGPHTVDRFSVAKGPTACG